MGNSFLVLATIWMHFAKISLIQFETLINWVINMQRRQRHQHQHQIRDTMSLTVHWIKKSVEPSIFKLKLSSKFLHLLRKSLNFYQQETHSHCFLSEWKSLAAIILAWTKFSMELCFRIWPAVLYSVPFPFNKFKR